jgi:hypothetical protein
MLTWRPQDLLTWRIQKIGVDEYRVTGERIDKGVNGSELMRMLAARGIQESLVAEFAAEEVGFARTVTLS